MNHFGDRVENLKIAYIGGGSRGWAWTLMSDLASAADISGQVALYDIDKEAAQANAIIGNKYNDLPETRSHWDYRAEDTLEAALTGADFVVISILPGTFQEMASDVHTPEEYGIYQSVGDTTGPGGIIRALRIVPMFETIGKAIRDFCPKAWVINYTNPMTVCVRTLFKVFPEIKAFGSCHEVFASQRFLASCLEEMLDIPAPDRSEIKVTIVGVNHFTWLTSAQYKNIDVMEVYRDYCNKHYVPGYLNMDNGDDTLYRFNSKNQVKMDLFLRYGSIAAAGDRHLAEFCEGKQYLADPATAQSWGFGLTPVSWRIENLEERLETSRKLVSGEEPVTIRTTGEEGVEQIRALLGLQDLITNVNIPNRGQIPNLPLDAVVETNAIFRANTLTAEFAGSVPMPIYGQITRIVSEQEQVVEAALERNLEKAYAAFRNNPLVNIPDGQSRELFDRMVANTSAYLQEYL